MKIKITESLGPIVTHPNGDISITGEIKTETNLKEFSDSEIREAYSVLKLKVEIMDNNPNLINEPSEYRIRTDFRKIRMEYESRFPVWHRD